MGAVTRGPAVNPDGSPACRLNTGKDYTLFYYDGGWQPAGRQRAQGRPLTFPDVPSGGLYWLVEEGSRKEERVFTLEDGRQAWW